MSLGLEMAVPVVLFGFLGYQLDRWLETEPGWMIGGGVLGMLVAFYQLFKRVQQLTPPPDGANEDTVDSDRSDDPNGPKT